MTENNERDALARLIDPNALELHAYPFPLDAADRVLAAGFTCHPQPTDGEPSGWGKYARVILERVRVNDKPALDFIDDVLRAAGVVADQEGENRG